MDWGYIVTDIIVFVISVVLTYIWNAYIRPYLEDKHLTEVAKVAVAAAESLYGSMHGDEKLEYAIELINNKYGITMDAEKIETAIEAAWQELDLNQITAGVKKN